MKDIGFVIATGAEDFLSSYSIEYDGDLIRKAWAPVPDFAIVFDTI